MDTCHGTTAGKPAVALVVALVLAALCVAAFAPDALTAIVKPPIFESVIAGDGDHFDSMTALAVGDDGLLYSCGTIWHDATGYDITVTCWADAPLGWTKTWSGAGGTGDQSASDVAVAPDGGIYVYGWDGDLDGRPTLLKYSPDGTLLWPAHDINDTWGAGGHIALDGDGNVYADWSKDGDEDGRPTVALTKYLADGTVAWSRRFGVKGYKTETYAGDLWVSDGGTVYLAGAALGVDFVRKAFVVSWTTAGKRRWAKLYDGPGRADAGFAAIAPCPAGGVYAAGDATSDARDLLLVRYAANGTRKRTKRLGVGEGHAQWATDVAVDGRGRIAVCGGWRFSNRGYYVALLRPDGSVVWAHDYAGDKMLGWARSLAIDASDRVCVTGNGRGAWLGASAPSAPATFVAGPVATYAFSRAGTLRWSCTWPAGFDPAAGATGPSPCDIAVWQSSNVWVCGHTDDRPVTGADQFVIGWGL